MVQYCILLAALFVAGSALPYKGISDELIDHTVFDGRIIGGTTAAEGAYPWMVAITTGFMTHIFLCGGAIISRRHAITAAHCVDAIMSSGQILNTRINVGSNKWNNSETRYSLRILSKNPDYDAVTKKNDIGIIGTTADIAFNNRVGPVTVNYDFFPSGVFVRVSGWGWTKTGGTLSDTLQEIRLITMEGDSCVQEVRRVAQSIGLHVPRVNPELEICTVLTGNEGICVGDGGSPLVRNSNNHLVGIASWGVACARGAPDVFARVSMHQRWIQSVLNIPL